MTSPSWKNDSWPLRTLFRAEASLLPRPDQLLDALPVEAGRRFLLVDGSYEPLAVAEIDPETGGGKLRRVLKRAATLLARA